MTRLTKTSLFAVLGLAVAFAGARDASACGGRGGYGGGYGGGYRYGSSYTSYHRPSYSRPVYRQPAQQHVRPIQQPVQPVSQQPLVQRQPVTQQGVASQAVAQRTVSQPQTTQPAVPQQPVQTAQTPTQTQTQPQTSRANAGQTALEMLSQFGGVETTQPEPTAEPAAQPAEFNGVGNWSATLGNGATIRLEMRADGSFTWTALKSGKPSTFSGTFALDGESLTLIRGDRKQLNGTLISPGVNGFTFKLDGVKDDGVQFARS